ncbi:MAG: response regulator transcription factor [Acetobacterales bacterium]
MSSDSTILVVDDDPRICRLLSRYLTQEGYQVETAHNGGEMRSLFKSRMVDLVLLDLVLPGDDGLSLARWLRGESRIPIIFLSGKGETVDKVVGLEVGADDYITKPFEQIELLARIRSVLRRSQAARDGRQPEASDAEVIRFDGWNLDTAAHRLTAPDGEEVPLTNAQFRLLCALASAPRRVLSRDQLLDLAWSRDWDATDRTVDIHISQLRRKLRDDAERPRLIKTVRGAGYMFEPSEQA